MYLEFVSDFGAWKKGDIPTETIPEGVARSLVDNGQAKEIDLTTWITRSMQGELKKAKDEMMEVARGSFRQPSQPERRPAPPNGGGGVDFNQIEGEGALDPRKLKPEERCFHAGQMVRALLCTQASEAPPEEREWGRSLLNNLYCSRRVDYRVGDGDDQKGAQRFNDNLSVTRTGTESVSGGPTYGFLVKPEWSDTLFRLPIEESVIEPYCFEIPVGQALEFKMPALDQYGTPTVGQSAAYAGFQISRKGEITQRQYSDGKVNEIDYKITDLTAFTTYSRDLDADAFIRIGALIQQVLGQAFQWKKDYEYINGNGVGMPMGILNGGGGNTTLHPSVLTVTRKNAGHIVYEDIVTMMQTVHPALWREMYWVTNSAWTLVELESIKNAAGTLLFQPNSLLGQWMTPSIMGDGNPFNRLTWGAQGRLQGKPVIFTEKTAQLGTIGDLILVNPRYAYGVATRAGLEMGMSEHFLFDTDRIAVRWKLRNDAKPLLRGPYIQSDGGASSNNAKVTWCAVLK